MFEDSLFATNARRVPRRGALTAISFVVQTLLLGVLVLMPLIYTDAIPLGNLKNWVDVSVPPGPKSTPPPQEPQPARPLHQSNMEGTTLLQPTRIPDRIIRVEETAAPPPVGPYVPGSTGGGGGTSAALFNSILASDMRPAPPAPPSAPPVRVVRISKIDEGLLVHKVLPVYPIIAKQTHVQGSVVMQATIARDGRIQGLQILSGHPLLIRAAMDAVRQWRYKPYLLNNEPVEVETQITVNFTLN